MESWRIVGVLHSAGARTDYGVWRPMGTSVLRGPPPCWTDTNTPRSPGCKSIIVAIEIPVDIAYLIGITA